MLQEPPTHTQTRIRARAHTHTHSLSLSLSLSPGTLVFTPVNCPNSPALEEAPPTVETSPKFLLRQLCSAVPTSGFRKWLLQTRE